MEKWKWVVISHWIKGGKCIHSLNLRFATRISWVKRAFERVRFDRKKKPSLKREEKRRISSRDKYENYKKKRGERERCCLLREKKELGNKKRESRMRNGFSGKDKSNGRVWKRGRKRRRRRKTEAEAEEELAEEEKEEKEAEEEEEWNNLTPICSHWPLNLRCTTHISYIKGTFKTGSRRVYE